jgi:cell division protease FtsH
MVYRLGMGEENGLLVYDEQAGPLSGEAQARMDAEVNALLQRLYARTRDIVEKNKPALQALAQALLERETIDGTDAVEILRTNGVA